jgi:hypothetical protein
LFPEINRSGWTVPGNGVKIQIVKVVNGNYGIRRVK